MARRAAKREKPGRETPDREGPDHGTPADPGGEGAPDAAPAAVPWREGRNAAARARLEKSLPAVFPVPVLRHALARPLVPPTPRLAVESYWRHHILRADRLARALAARSGQPEGWTWRLGTASPEAAGPRKGGRGSGTAGEDLSEKGLPFSFRMPPAPFREGPHALGKGHCCVCGQPVYRFGWHRDLWGTGAPNRNAAWHAACVAAWKFWIAPTDHVKELKRRQGHRCAQSGKRLLRTAEIDHRVPLYRIWREERARPWPALLAYWGVPNLQVVNRAIHVDKCAAEAGERASVRRAGGAPDEPFGPAAFDLALSGDPLSGPEEG